MKYVMLKNFAWPYCCDTVVCHKNNFSDTLITTMSISIIIFEDNDQLRGSLVVLLNSSNEYAVIGDYSNVMDAAMLIRRDQPEVVIMDIDMPGKTGIEGVAEIKEARPQTAVIMYTMF